MAKKMIIKGVGTFMAKRYNPDNTKEIITLGTLQDLKIDLNVELDDIFGGDGLFAIDTLVKSKSIEVSATDAKFDLDALQLMMGSTVQEGVAGTIWVLNEQATVATDGADGAVLPDFRYSIPNKVGDALEFAGFDTDGFQVRKKDSNTLLERITVGNPTATQFKWDAVNFKLVFNAAMVGEDIVMNYRRNVPSIEPVTDTIQAAAGTNGTADVALLTGLTKVDSIVHVDAVNVVVKKGLTAYTWQDYAVDTAPDAGKFMYDAANKQIILPDGEDPAVFTVSYLFQSTDTIDVVDLLVDEVPFPVSIVHHGSFVQKDGTFQGIETELYACRAKGTFSINAARSTASASQIALEIIDPERADGKLGTIKRYAATQKV